MIYNNLIKHLKFEMYKIILKFNLTLVKQFYKLNTILLYI